ncbi:esterase/lipase family protein [Virgibacillus oceani]
MTNHVKRLLLIGFLAIFTFGIGFSVEAADSKANAPKPALTKESDEMSTTGKVGNGNEETPGEWYLGDVPGSPVPNAPVILFVPGLNNVAQVFWEDNDMYETALNAGYQTAFIQLHDAGGASADMWDNGELLAEKIEEISSHFDRRPITVVAYSKGGVDTQTALTYYGAWEYVDNVITLSSPHHGAQLADLAYSSWAGWIADLIGAQGDGTYSLQMANMENFRTQVDNEPIAYHNNYYTLAGTDWGSIFSSTWLGGMYLSQFGSNDGVVTTNSSRLSGGEEITIGDWNHTSIRTGATFPVFEDYLMGQQQELDTSFSSSDYVEKNTPATNQWVHGGPLMEGDANELSLAVEDGVKNVSLHLMSANKVSNITLVDPAGNEIAPKVHSNVNKDGVFAGAISHYLIIDEPAPGEWSIKLDTKYDDAYLLVADFTADSIIIRNEMSDSAAMLQSNYYFEVDQKQVQGDTVKATYRVTESSNPENSTIYTTSGLHLSEILEFDRPNEVYNITIDVEGRTKTGEVFKRTIIDSVYAD